MTRGPGKRLAAKAKNDDFTLLNISTGSIGRSSPVADVAKLLMMAEELLIVAWNQVNEAEKSKLWTALEIVKEVRVQRETMAKK